MCTVAALAPTTAAAVTSTDVPPAGTRAAEGTVMSLESHRRRTTEPLGEGAWRSNVIVRVTVAPVCIVALVVDIPVTLARLSCFRREPLVRAGSASGDVLKSNLGAIWLTG